ncbi:carbohydrate kinase [Leucogyrophana mollusca]|uniref:Carbohydrate kinase n=1 Tax=Leucogyrophana mollusca TaxID=85980 RepID=A0ACB8B0T6_9AGAM|nr:carbohydrate kinase [Leucogyrophana mollusca]
MSSPSEPAASLPNPEDSQHSESDSSYLSSSEDDHSLTSDHSDLTAFDHHESAEQDISHAVFLVVMGVSGTGKSTLGTALSKALHLPFIDGDDLHPKSNVEKMSRGEPLTDADREPWLEIIRTTAHKRVEAQMSNDPCEIPSSEPESKPKTEKALDEYEEMAAKSGEIPDDEDLKSYGKPKHLGIIIACSALKKSYREVLRGAEKPGALPPDLATPHSQELPTYFVYMKGGKGVLMDRMQKRKGHFMKAKMLESQLATLESPEEEEGVVTVPIEWSTEEQVKEIQEALEERFYEVM